MITMWKNQNNIHNPFIMNNTKLKDKQLINMVNKDIKYNN